MRTTTTTKIELKREKNQHKMQANHRMKQLIQSKNHSLNIIIQIHSVTQQKENKNLDELLVVSYIES